jgi:hypothetical protein
MWISAAQTQSVVHSGGNVDFVRDALGRTSLTRTLGSFGSLKYVPGRELTFDGTCNLSSPVNFLQGVQARAVFTVFTTRGSSSDSGVFRLQNAGSYSVAGLTHHFGGTVYAYYGGGAQSAQAAAGLNSRHVYSTRWNGLTASATDVVARLNNGAQFNAVVAPLAHSIDTLICGAGNTPWVGGLHELVILPYAPSDAEFLAIHNALRGQWGV